MSLNKSMHASSEQTNAIPKKDDTNMGTQDAITCQTKYMRKIKRALLLMWCKHVLFKSDQSQQTKLNMLLSNTLQHFTEYQHLE